jgi:hypothetical protein
MKLFLACVACVAAATITQPSVALVLIVLAVCSFVWDLKDAQ